jgi:hypothetical protein
MFDGMVHNCVLWATTVLKSVLAKKVDVLLIQLFGRWSHMLWPSPWGLRFGGGDNVWNQTGIPLMQIRVFAIVKGSECQGLYLTRRGSSTIR